MAKREIRFGVIGCGLMGREFASAAARWLHLLDLDYAPRIEAVCDVNLQATEWFKDNVPSVRLATDNYEELLNDAAIEVIYCAVPHNLHEKIYSDIIRSGKHLLGEKPFGIDQAANTAILEAARENPDVLVRCTSQLPFFPGAYQIIQWLRDGRFGRIIEYEAGFWHSSDLNPLKPINWKRMIEMNGEYGCMGDLGMHVYHIPSRFGFKPRTVRAMLSKIVTERPDRDGNMVPCLTWDNAILACDVDTGDQKFPMTLSTKRIAPGHNNTWFVKVQGTDLSAEFSTQFPKQLRYMPYTAGGKQEWRVIDMLYASAYKTITGSIFEFGFSDAILQMWAAYCDEFVNGMEGMQQPFGCVRPDEVADSHKLFTAALESNRESSAVAVD